MVEKKESFDEKCRRLGLFDKSIEDIIDMIAEKNREIERLKAELKVAYAINKQLCSAFWGPTGAGKGQGD